MELQPIQLTVAQKSLIGAYFALWSVFAALGVRRLWLLWLYRRARGMVVTGAGSGDLPRVTVQLPVYNELYVVRRLIRSVAALDYPRDRLEIQVLDDSTDGTVALVREEVDRLRAEGLDIRHLRREHRRGYKAGALEYGMDSARGDFLLIFDADFVPKPDLLRRIVPHFADERIGMVQVRWDHLNADHSLLSRVQAISLDGHFVVEHEARAKNGLFFNFNGTAGMWRRRCIDDAGGWQHDTLTEDLDLSYRAHLKGWKFVYLRDVTCSAELPVDMRSFKSQQFRWVKGSVQVSKKILPRIWRSDLPLGRKIEASVHLTHNLTYALVLLLSLCAYPAVLTRFAGRGLTTLVLELPLFLLATGSVMVFYAVAMAHVRPDWRRRLRYLPVVMSVAIGLSVSNTRAILEGLIGRETPFHRTPTFDVSDRVAAAHRGKEYRGRQSATAFVEVLLAGYFGWVLFFVIDHGLLGAVPFVLLFLFGYLYVGLLSMDLPLRRRVA
jgi:cellulose synthase/poly-beta-1,6-N-acetylglucosamine synthase-like glycosyltransferase